MNILKILNAEAHYNVRFWVWFDFFSNIRLWLKILNLSQKRVEFNKYIFRFTWIYGGMKIFMSSFQEEKNIVKYKAAQTSVWPQRLFQTTKQQREYCIFKALLRFHGYFLFHFFHCDASAWLDFSVKMQRRKSPSSSGLKVLGIMT